MMEESAVIRGARPPTGGRACRGPCGFLVAAALHSLVLASCGSAPASDDEGPSTAPVVVDVNGPERQLVSAGFEPAFRAVQGALEDGEDELARRILDGLLARRPRGDDLEVAEAFGRVLRGREIVRALDLRLVSEPAEEAGLFRLSLLATQHTDASLELQLPPANLRHVRSGIDPDGFEQTEVETRLLHDLNGLILPPGRQLRIELTEYSVPMGRCMARRDRWLLDVLSGDVIDATGSCPASGVRVEPCERTFLASFLSATAVDPALLVEYLLRNELYLPPLLERAVRIAPGRREEALAALLPALRDPRNADERRMAKILPALRWLAGTGEPGASAESWIEYLEARRDASRRSEQRKSRSGLDLPGTAGALRAPRRSGRIADVR